MPSDVSEGRLTVMPDWNEWEAKLSAAGADQVDDAVDALASAVLAGAPDVLAVPSLVQAAGLARSDLSQSRVASALAWAADPDDAVAVDCLGGECRKYKANAFLGSSFLGALGLLGLCGYLARTEAIGQIARLRLTDNRYVLVCGAKVIGLLDDRQSDEGLRSKLRELETSPIPPVKAEARYQLALMCLRSALLAEDTDGLLVRLGEARDGFARAEISEEVRPDAALLGTLAAVTLDLATLGLDPQGATGRLRDGAMRLRRFQGTSDRKYTSGYRSDAAVGLSQCAIQIGRAVEEAANEVADAPKWIDLKRHFVRLAEAYLAVRQSSVGIPGHDGIEAAMRAIAYRALAPQMGPLLRRWIGGERIGEIVRAYRDQRGEDDVYLGLLALEQVAAEDGVPPRLGADEEAQFAAVATLLNTSPADLVRDIADSARKGGVSWLAAGLGLGMAAKAQRLEKGRFDELWAALLAVFDRNSMQQMLRVKMGVNLEDEVPQGGFRDQVFFLIQWAEGAGRVDELARMALEARPHSHDLRAYVAGLKG